MTTLHVFTADNEEWVIAESAEDANAVYGEHLGDPDSDGNTPDDWEQLPDDKVIRVAEECPEHHHEGIACHRGCDEGYIIHHAKTAAEWTAQGRGHLASADW